MYSELTGSLKTHVNARSEQALSNQLYLPPSSFSGEDRGERSKEAPPGNEWEPSVRLR